MYHTNNKMTRECKLGDQCNVIAVFPLTPDDDDDGQLCVCVTVVNHHNSEKEAGLSNEEKFHNKFRLEFTKN